MMMVLRQSKWFAHPLRGRLKRERPNVYLFHTRRGPLRQHFKRQGMNHKVHRSSHYLSLSLDQTPLKTTNLKDTHLTRVIRSSHVTIPPCRGTTDVENTGLLAPTPWIEKKLDHNTRSPKVDRLKDRFSYIITCLVYHIPPPLPLVFTFTFFLCPSMHAL